MRVLMTTSTFVGSFQILGVKSQEQDLLAVVQINDKSKLEQLLACYSARE